MSNTFLTADTHFGHKNILTFKGEDGNPIRDFNSVEEMDEHLVDCWNKVVKPKDTVYHLGDVCINRRALKTVERLNGRKILIKGNHDVFRANEYLEYFEDIRAYKIFAKHRIICSHIPIHPESLNRWDANFHGHLHANNIPFYSESGEKYYCVSVEQNNYEPISLDKMLEIKGIIQGGSKYEN